MYHIEIYNKKEKLVADFYLNPAAVASLHKNVDDGFATGRLFNGQAFVIPAENLSSLMDLVDKASGTSGHDVSKLPFKPIDLDIHPAGDQSDSNGSLAQVNHNLKFIWENTREGEKTKLTPEELAGKNS